MKLGRAVEISPRVLMVQFTSWERMSHAASADSVQLSTWFTSNNSTVGGALAHLNKWRQTDLSESFAIMKHTDAEIADSAAGSSD